MGLAAMGSATYEFPEIELSGAGYQVRMVGEDKPARMIGWLRRFEEVFGPAATAEFRMDASTGLLRAPAALVPHLREAAASAQAALERTLLHLARLARDMTGSPNLVLSGGVALNCTANGRLRQAAGSGGMFVSGAVHDGGTALGAALAVAAEQGEPLAPGRSRSLFTGPMFDPGPAIEQARRLGLVVAHPSSDLAAQVSRRLSDDQIGGWFRGRPEYGPRALGARSIIARADAAAVRARVNQIKGREPWRPLAPALNSSTAAALGMAGEGLDFMVEARWLPEGPPVGPMAGIVHVDHSVRPLVVYSPQHPFADLLDAIERDTGAGVLTNTSFNQDYEPIVNSPMDALRTFAASDLDFLVLEDALLSKQR
jgi:carbamoyltransferase